MKILRNWYFRNAQWYHFWRPQSSTVGGIILGVTIGIIICLVLWMITLSYTPNF